MAASPYICVTMTLPFVWNCLSACLVKPPVNKCTIAEAKIDEMEGEGRLLSEPLQGTLCIESCTRTH